MAPIYAIYALWVAWLVSWVIAMLWSSRAEKRGGVGASSFSPPRHSAVATFSCGPLYAPERALVLMM